MNNIEKRAKNLWWFHINCCPTGEVFSDVEAIKKDGYILEPIQANTHITHQYTKYELRELLAYILRLKKGDGILPAMEIFETVCNSYETRIRVLIGKNNTLEKNLKNKKYLAFE